MLTLSEILAIEDDEEILSFRCPRTGWPMWPALRAHVLSRLVYALGEPAPRLLHAFKRTPSDYWRALAAVAPAAIHNRVNRARLRDRPVRIVSHNYGLVPWDNRVLNRLGDHFAIASGGSAMLWEDCGPRYAIPQERMNADVLYTLPFALTRFVLERCIPATASASVARQFVHYLAGRVRALFGTAAGSCWSDNLESYFHRMSARYAIDRRYFARTLDEDPPRLLMIHSACSGARVPLILLARERGIVVAESQHGLINEGHSAYNFGEAMRASSSFRATLPDCLLTFGRWWTSRINAPVRTIEIGYPHRTESLRRAADGTGARSDVLVVAKMSDADTYLALAVELARALPDRRVVFRPNPIDRSRFLQRYTSPAVGSLVIDVNDDVYVSLASAEILVSGPSTVLMEGIGLARRIFMWDYVSTRFQYPETLFERFSSAGDLVEKIRSPAPAVPAHPPAEEVWAPGWKARYTQFVQPFLATA